MHNVLKCNEPGDAYSRSAASISVFNQRAKLEKLTKNDATRAITVISHTEHR